MLSLGIDRMPSKLASSKTRNVISVKRRVTLLKFVGRPHWPKGPISVNLEINNKPVSFQLDTGAALPLITEKNFHTFFKSVLLQVSTKVLHAYSEQSVSVLGPCVVEVDDTGQQQRLPLLVVKGNGPPLMGRSWLEKIHLLCEPIRTIRTISPIT